ncbi:hypothetical protein G7046_g1069 [Stylonectria norvegica]|nr:hypothetical protein G7046_g1069 [Stylonectria norvegica]
MATSAIDPNYSRPLSGNLSPRPMRSRTQSISSDRPSTIAHSLMSPPLSVSPEAAFIAASAASQIVTNDHDSHADTWYDQHGIEPAGETALVSPEALQLVNNFLDQLLFNFLQGSRGTTLATLRPAVSEVLKPKLAKDAVNNADEELREYLGGGEEDDLAQPHGSDPERDWDLELVWKRTRLRCMVYSSLGDMEEEDEDLHMEQENLEIGVDESISDVISPAVAIFLTSVLEYMGELTLTVAGQAAYHRLRAKFEKDLKEGVKNPSDIADRIVIEEGDMERVALDRTLGRLWRGWKKRIRSPLIDTGRPFSRSSTGHLRQDSSYTDGASLTRTTTQSDMETEVKKPAKETTAEILEPFDIALPMGHNDVDEIEVPGLASYSDDEGDDDDEEETEKDTTRRPRSLLILPGLGIMTDLPTPTISQPHTPVTILRKRANSLPTPGSSPYRSSKRPSEPTTTTEVADGESNPEIESNNPDVADTTEEPTPKATTQDKRLSKLMTASSSPAAAAMTGITATAQDESSKALDVDSTATYEKAEIMTSARVSVAGSSSPSLSDAGTPFLLRRSSSVHSARLVDVTGPKSPTGSRPPSVDMTDKVRPVSLTPSRTSSISNRSNTEEPRMPKVLENVTRSAIVVPKSRSPVDRLRGSISNEATISESDEEADGFNDQGMLKNSTYQPSPLTSHPPAGPATHHYPSHRQASINSKVSAIHPSISAASYEVPSPELSHQVASPTSRNISRDDKSPTSPTRSIGMVSVERMKSRDSDEDAGNTSLSGSGPRAIHTSGSSASSGTSRIKAVRTSEELNSGRSESVARNFEELIKGNQTITYTLTPENMREIEAKRSPDSPGANKMTRLSDEARGHDRSRSSSSAGTNVKGASPHRRTAGLGSISSIDSKPRNSGSTTRATGKSIRLSGAQARDARIPAESTADFAEFIKSTGPAGDNRPAVVRNVGSPSAPSTPNLDSRRVSTASNRNRYQPREAVIDKSGNSDLIDFIRQGPPSAVNNRIPNHIAPFLDPEEMSGASTGGRAVDANIPDIRYSEASTHGTDVSMPSLHSSVNSHTALLKSRGGSTATSTKTMEEDDMMPKRKTRRVRDPYAIDLSDEDDDDDFITTTPKPPVKKEESLAEFLQNYDPPPEPVAPPISHKVPKKKASAPSLIGRFTRGSISNHSGSNSLAPSPVGNDSRSISSRSGIRGYIPIQVSMPAGYDKYGPIDKGSASRPSMPTATGSAGRVPMKRFEPREAASNVSRTSDLASFLRNSEPPPEPVMQPPPKEEGSTLSKMFGRRKKSPLA